VLLRGLPVFAGELPGFDAGSVADRPDVQFRRWLDEALAAGVREPHAMTVSTLDADGLPAARTLILKNVDETGWQFASRKGQVVAAALTFYWAPQGRQVRVRGPVLAESADRSAADFLARSPGSRAEALAGPSGEPLGSRAELLAAFDAALGSDEVAAGWTLYTVRPAEVEFFQGDPDRRHVRLRYTRDGNGWRHTLLWP
jgi:pyridoxamine 5'-phosphate oxidase